MEEKDEVRILSTEEALQLFKEEATLETVSATDLTTEEAKEVFE